MDMIMCLPLFLSLYIKSGYCYHLKVKIDKEGLTLQFYKNEIELRRKIYELCGKYDIWDIEYMNILLDHICEANIAQ